MIFFPLGPKQLEFAVFETINSLWLRKIRVRDATLDLNQLSQSMVQNGLTTIRDVRIAHAELVQAQHQAEVAREAESIRAQIAELARNRLDAGDISELEATCERLGLAKRQFTLLDAVYDANGSGDKGFESGPGLRFTIPIFNRNRGGIAIAKAQWQKAARQYVTVRDRVTLDVRTAYSQLIQARENLRVLQSDILPSLEEAQRLAQRNYESGGATYFLVLQTTGPYLDARRRESILLADVRRATAELERSVGTRLTSPVEEQAPPEVLFATEFGAGK